jgi:hypothetical protein
MKSPSSGARLVITHKVRLKPLRHTALGTALNPVLLGLIAGLAAAGQSTSVRAALSALPENVGAVLFHLVDLPAVPPGVLRARAQCHAATLALEHAVGLLVVQLLAREVILAYRFAAHFKAPGASPPQDLELPSLHQRQAAIWSGFVACCHDIGHDPLRALVMAPIGLDEDEPAYYIIHQLIQRFESGPASSHPLHSAEVQMWRDLFAVSFEHQGIHIEGTKPPIPGRVSTGP